MDLGINNENGSIEDNVDDIEEIKEDDISSNEDINIEEESSQIN